MYVVSGHVILKSLNKIRLFSYVLFAIILTLNLLVFTNIVSPAPVWFINLFPEINTLGLP